MLALTQMITSGLPLRMEAVTLQTILTDIGTILESMFGWVSNVFTAIVGNPILFLMVVGTFGLICIGIVRRLLKL